MSNIIPVTPPATPKLKPAPGENLVAELDLPQETPPTTIEDLINPLTKLTRYNCPDSIKKSASDFNQANKNRKVAQARLKLAEEEARLKNNPDILKQAQTNFFNAFIAAENLFVDFKTKYINWYDKNVPENIKNAWLLCGEDAEVRILYHWFRENTYINVLIKNY